MGNFNYEDAIKGAKTYGRCKGFMPGDSNYDELCKWVRTLTDNYRIRMFSYTVVVKKLPPNKDNKDLLLEFYHKTKLILVSLIPKSREFVGE